MTVWIISIVIVVAFLYPFFTVAMSHYFDVDTSQEFRTWVSPLLPEALKGGQHIRERAALPHAPFTILRFTTGLGRILMIILSASMAVDEFTRDTTSNLIEHMRNCVAFLCGKFVVITATTLLLTAGVVIAGTLSGAVITPAVIGETAGVPFTAKVFVRSLIAPIIVALTILPYAMFAFLIALNTRSSVAGVSIGLLTLIVGEPVLVQIFSSMGSPWSKIVIFTPFVSNQFVKEWLAATTGGSLSYIARTVLVLVAYTLALAGLAYASFRRRELTA